MFCPRCGSEQASDNMRFCSRCGLTLGGVVELLSTGRYVSPSNRSSLYEEIRRQMGAKFIFLSIFLAPLALLFSIIFDSPLPFLAPLALFVLGIAQIAYVLMFNEERLYPKEKGFDELDPASARFDLGPARNIAVSIFDGRRADTGSFAPRPSVTEATTNLLEPGDDNKS